MPVDAHEREDHITTEREEETTGDERIVSGRQERGERGDGRV